VRQWLGKAGEDFLTAELIVANDLPAYWTASFHAQQTAEKALKALLTYYQIDFMKTHSIGELLQLAEPVVSGISNELDAARDLTEYAVRDRYPGPESGVTRATAREHVAIARTVLDFVSVRLRAYLDAGPPAS
jgi:HEPN domain-containing protein